MSIIDWIVLLSTLLAIVAYGMYKSRRNESIDSYLKGDNTMKWATIGLSVMATQASAITFLSTPGQAFESGMAFVQNYFGLPIAIVIVSAIFIPIYYKLKVFTAYEYLESRFDAKTRSLAAFLFLVQRGMAAGMTIYAPAIILSTVLNLNLSLTILIVGILVIVYTVSGGTRAVSLTQKYQMLVIFAGMFVAYFILIYSFPETVGFGDALNVAGALGKMDAVDFSLDIDKRYTFWSGIFGGVFLSLSYFGADQSQVQRYIGGKDITASRIGLLLNAVVKIPMQFFILFVGVMLFIFYQFEKQPVFFNTSEVNLIEDVSTREKLGNIEEEWSNLHQQKKEAIVDYIEAERSQAADLAVKKDQVITLHDESLSLKSEYKSTLEQANPNANTKDSDYVFITFILNFLPVGVVGLLIAVIFSAAMSSTSGELNALGSTTTIDFYKRYIRKEDTGSHFVKSSRIITLGWGIVAIIFALVAQLVENLIEFVNIIGSIFYGPILGIFVVAFFIKYIRSSSVFVAAIISELVIISLHFINVYEVLPRKIAYLWYNPIGCLLVVILAVIFESFSRKTNLQK